jgi:hypothetical protein
VLVAACAAGQHWLWIGEALVDYAPPLIVLLLIIAVVLRRRRWAAGPLLAILALAWPWWQWSAALGAAVPATPVVAYYDARGLATAVLPRFEAPIAVVRVGTEQPILQRFGHDAPREIIAGDQRFLIWGADYRPGRSDLDAPVTWTLRADDPALPAVTLVAPPPAGGGPFHWRRIRSLPAPLVEAVTPTIVLAPERSAHGAAWAALAIAGDPAPAVTPFTWWRGHWRHAAAGIGCTPCIDADGVAMVVCNQK